MKEVLLKNFDSIGEAELIRGILKQQGIESLIQKGGIEIPGDLGDFGGGAKLFIMEGRLEKAREILESFKSDSG